MDQDDAVRRNETLELAAHRSEARGLDLDELVATDHVHDEAVHGGLHPRVGHGRRVAGFQRRVERALAVGREVRHGGAATSTGPRWTPRLDRNAGMAPPDGRWRVAGAPG